MTLLIRRPTKNNPPSPRTRDRRSGVPLGGGRRACGAAGGSDDPAPSSCCAILPNEHCPRYRRRLLSLCEEPALCRARPQVICFAQRFLSSSSSSSLIRDTMTTLALRPSRRAIQLFIFPEPLQRLSAAAAGSPSSNSLRSSSGLRSGSMLCLGPAPSVLSGRSVPPAPQEAAPHASECALGTRLPPGTQGTRRFARTWRNLVQLEGPWGSAAGWQAEPSCPQ